MLRLTAFAVLTACLPQGQEPSQQQRPAADLQALEKPKCPICTHIFLTQRIWTSFAKIASHSTLCLICWRMQHCEPCRAPLGSQHDREYPQILGKVFQSSTSCLWSSPHLKESGVTVSDGQAMLGWRLGLPASGEGRKNRSVFWCCAVSVWGHLVKWQCWKVARAKISP